MEKELYERFFVAEETHWWFRARRRILASVMESLQLSENAEIVDFGCGTGGMMQVLARFGRVTGVDDAPLAREYCARRGFSSVLTPEAWADTNHTYDVITAFDVVEHVDDDVDLLDRLRQRLGVGGHLVVTVPAYQWLWSEFDEMNHHRRRYTRGRLEKTLGRAGFMVERSSYFQSLLFPPMALVRLLDKIRPSGAGADPQEALDRWFRIGALNGFLEAIFASERHWLRYGRFPFGSSILALGRRTS